MYNKGNNKWNNTGGTTLLATTASRRLETQAIRNSGTIIQTYK